eukprot:scaffold200330_cov19-Prasinocladus_malaysianus.AAC.1
MSMSDPSCPPVVDRLIWHRTREWPPLQRDNKARYTAYWDGLNKWMDKWMDGCMNGWLNGRTDGWID